MSNHRLQEINDTIDILHSFKKDAFYTAHHYAIEQNIAFLEAIRTVPAYIRWLFKVAPRIDGSQIVEPTDFPVEEWDIKMHKQLIQVQRDVHIGLCKPLVDAIVSYILSEKRDLVLADLGAGGMEIERQIITLLQEKNHPYQTIFVGIDRSPTTQKIAIENLQTVPGLHIYEIAELTPAIIEELKRTEQGTIVVICKNDIFGLAADFSNTYFDIVYHSLFKHHLTDTQRQELSTVLETISKHIYEYDGYRTWPVVIPQSITGWNHPLFLADTILSFLRYPNKEQIIVGKGTISFFKKTGHYLLKTTTS